MSLIARSCIPRLFSSSAPRASALTSLRVDRNAPIDIHPEVVAAIQSGQPVVALETTVVTHGLPFPTNLETAQSLENIVRGTGSVPATIGIIGGRVKVGLKPSELERLADTSRNSSLVKISRRDIGPVLATKRDGGTTCSATLIFAALAGIKVFATGGLGGVHRGGQSSLDISADLQDLSRCPVGLVSAGVKSILDIGRTLEYLETLGVPVLAYGKTDDFPAFFATRSGYKVPWNVSSPQAAAQVLYSQWQLGMMNGAVFGVPIPPEYEAAGEKIQKVVEQAVAEAEESGISSRGKAVTPWLLNRVSELTEGTSLTSNVALIQNTALTGGQIAVEYAKLASESARKVDHLLYPIKGPVSYDNGVSPQTTRNSSASDIPPAQVKAESAAHVQQDVKLMVIGCAAVDISAQTNVDKLWPSHSTTPGTVTLSLGGVGRNIAEAAHRVLASQGSPLSTVLLSCVGDDAFGRLLSEEMQRLGMRTDGLIQLPDQTAVCNMFFDTGGNLVGGVADMNIIASLDPKTVLQQIERYKPSLIALDANLSPNLLGSIIQYCNRCDINVLFEPTSITKSANIFPTIAASLDSARPDKSPIAFSSPNLSELAQMYQAARTDDMDLTTHDRWWKTIDNFSLGSEFRMNLEQLARRDVSDHDSSNGTMSFLVDEGIAQMAVNLLPIFQHLVIKSGERGVIVAMRISGRDVESSGWIHEHSNAFRRCVVATNSSSKEVVVLQHFPALPADNIISVTGAGDTLVGYLLARLIRDPAIFQHPATLSDAINAAQRAAVLTLQSNHAVSPLLSTPFS